LRWEVRTKEKELAIFIANSFCIAGRDGGIRTHDPLHPMQVRYQAALRPEDRKYIRIQTAMFGFVIKIK
jgi:hypothetical protein